MIPRYRLRIFCLLGWFLFATFAAGGSGPSKPSADDDTTTSSTTTKDFTDSFLLLCLTDGSIYSLNAWTGDYHSVLRTDPLLQTNSGAENDDSNNNDDGSARSSSTPHTNMVLPGLDGRLYWQPDDDRPLQELPLTVTALLENPVRSCDDDDGDDNKECGILTAQAITSLLALTDTGELLWETKGSSQPPADAAHKNPSLLLQRKDYWIQHVLASTGQQSWNVSLGTYQALDFGISPTPMNNDFLLDDDTVHGNGIRHSTEEAPLPSVIFSNAGRTLTAVDPTTEDVLWRQDTPSTLAAVFGISRGQWKTVDVMQQQQQQHEENDNSQYTYQKELPASEGQKQNYESFLWSQKWAGYQEQQLAAAQEQRGLVVDHRTQQTQTVNDGNDVCAEDSEQCISAQEQLLLPSPTTPLQKTADGLLLSWPIVTGLVVCIVTSIAGFRIWYVRKKEKWVSTNHPNPKTIQWKESSTMSTPQSMIRRSNSLPGTLGLIDPLAAQQIPKSDEGLQTAVIELHQPSTVMIDGTIPLVRYSRYASEFLELTALGKGGFGSVFKCTNKLDRVDYAVKKVSIRGAQDQFQQQLERVIREVKILAVLDHPNIVRYYTAWLELVDDDGQTTVQDTVTGMSRHFSSSHLLNTDSVSGWGNSVVDSESCSSWGPSRHVEKQNRNPLRFQDDESEGLPSGLPRRRSIRNRASMDDLMIFEDSQEDKEQSEDVPSDSGSVSRESSVSVRKKRSLSLGDEHKRQTTVESIVPLNTATVEGADNIDFMKHTLYIQMQLCNHKTVAEFLTDKEARSDASTENSVDLIRALRIFLQIAEAVKHVHSQGLIHRDLKPCNCFLDNSGSTVKVGDFGLSRESASDEPEERSRQVNKMHESDSFDGNDDHTAGVGTRSYASPEQMNGSDYDSSTDVYSLGIILFELLYPMYTGMERNICLSRLRDGIFPNDWDSVVGTALPKIQTMIMCMMSRSPSNRPSSESVARRIESLLGEFTISMTLDRQHEGPDMVLLRVEAKDDDDALKQTMQAIHEESRAVDDPVDIVQYGLRSAPVGEKPAAILEFALKYSSSSTTSSTNERHRLGHRSTSLLISKLVARPEIFKARQVSSASSSS